MPVPAGETGGGVAHAIVGHADHRGHGLPDRRADRDRRPGIYCAEYGGTRLALDHPVRGRRAQRHAVDRGRRLRVDLDRRDAEALLRARRRRGAGDPDDPDGDAHHRGADQAGAELAARGGAGAGLSALAHRARSWCRDRAAGHRDRLLLAVGARRRRNGAAAVHGAGQPVHRTRPGPADGGAAADGLHLRDRPVRGVAPAGVGGRAGADPGRPLAARRRRARRHRGSGSGRHG